MRIVLLTQDEPFYLAENIDYLVSNLPSHAEIVACCLFEASPFGKKETYIGKIKRTLSVFGLKFFLFYSIKYLSGKISLKKNIKVVLDKHGVKSLKLVRSINDPASVEELKSYNPDLLISIAGNQIFKKPIINLAAKGCLNLHTSLLPKNRGLMPSFWVLKNDEAETGVSVFFVDEGIDSGPILVQERIQIGDASQQDLIKRTKRIGMDALLCAIDLIQKGEYSLIENSEKDKTYNSFPTRKDVQLFLQRGKTFF